jgi:anti-sigma-K factor RskA
MNTTKSTAKEREPSEIEMLLPWYAAGTLDAAEARQVEAALAADPELAQRYEWVRTEFAQETSINAAAGEPSADDVKTLFAKIDALPAPARRPAASSGLAQRVAEFLASLSPRTLAWSAMAASLAIVLQAGLIAGIAYKESTGGYQTASVPANTAGDGAYVLMRFQPQASAGDIAAFMETNKLSIVGGPFGGALYRVRVAPTKLSKDDLARIVMTLQSDKVVGFIAATD